MPYACNRLQRLTPKLLHLNRTIGRDIEQLKIWVLTALKIHSLTEVKPQD